MFMTKLNYFSFMTSMILFFILMNSSSIYIQWLSMEFSTILLISMINIKSKNKISSIMYFLISSISSLMIALTITLNFSQLILNQNYYLNSILLISMFMKIGIFPFCFWMIKIYIISSWMQIFILSTLMKFIPIYFFSLLTNTSNYLLTTMIFNNVYLAFYTNLNYSTKKLFGCSSIFNSLFFYYIITYNKNVFILLFSMYMIMFLMLMYLFNFYNIKNLNFKFLSFKSYYMLIILIFIYSSFPLFLTFFLKWQFTYLFTSIYSSNLMILLLLSSMMMLWNYFTLFKTLILNFKFLKNYMKLEMFMMNLFIPLMILLYSSMFLLFNLY
nr:TPA_asm: ND2 [Bombus personatus]